MKISSLINLLIPTSKSVSGSEKTTKRANEGTFLSILKKAAGKSGGLKAPATVGQVATGLGIGESQRGSVDNARSQSPLTISMKRAAVTDEIPATVLLNHFEKSVKSAASKGESKATRDESSIADEKKVVADAKGTSVNHEVAAAVMPSSSAGSQLAATKKQAVVQVVQRDKQPPPARETAVKENANKNSSEASRSSANQEQSEIIPSVLPQSERNHAIPQRGIVSRLQTVIRNIFHIPTNANDQTPVMHQSALKPTLNYAGVMNADAPSQGKESAITPARRNSEKPLSAVRQLSAQQGADNVNVEWTNSTHRGYNPESDNRQSKKSGFADPPIVASKGKATTTETINPKTMRPITSTNVTGGQAISVRAPDVNRDRIETSAIVDRNATVSHDAAANVTNKKAVKEGKSVGKNSEIPQNTALKDLEPVTVRRNSRLSTTESSTGETSQNAANNGRNMRTTGGENRIPIAAVDNNSDKPEHKAGAVTPKSKIGKTFRVIQRFWQGMIGIERTPASANAEEHSIASPSTSTRPINPLKGTPLAENNTATPKPDQIGGESIRHLPGTISSKQDSQSAQPAVGKNTVTVADPQRSEAEVKNPPAMNVRPHTTTSVESKFTTQLPRTETIVSRESGKKPESVQPMTQTVGESDTAVPKPTVHITTDRQPRRFWGMKIQVDHTISPQSDEHNPIISGRPDQRNMKSGGDKTETLRLSEKSAEVKPQIEQTAPQKASPKDHAEQTAQTRTKPVAVPTTTAARTNAHQPVTHTETRNTQEELSINRQPKETNETKVFLPHNAQRTMNRASGGSIESVTESKPTATPVVEIRYTDSSEPKAAAAATTEKLSGSTTRNTNASTSNMVRAQQTITENPRTHQKNPTRPITGSPTPTTIESKVPESASASQKPEYQPSLKQPQSKSATVQAKDPHIGNEPSQKPTVRKVDAVETRAREAIAETPAIKPQSSINPRSKTLRTEFETKPEQKVTTEPIIQPTSSNRNETDAVRIPIATPTPSLTDNRSPKPVLSSVVLTDNPKAKAASDTGRSSHRQPEGNPQSQQQSQFAEAAKSQLNVRPTSSTEAVRSIGDILKPTAAKTAPTAPAVAREVREESLTQNAEMKVEANQTSTTTTLNNLRSADSLLSNQSVSLRPRFTAAQVLEFQEMAARALENSRIAVDGTADVRFNWQHESLGMLEFRFTTRKEEVTIEISSGSKDVADALDEVRPAVERAIADLGLKVERFEVRLKVPNVNQDMNNQGFQPNRNPEQKAEADTRISNPVHDQTSSEPIEEATPVRPVLADHEWVA
ncbi:MAG: hypothetical protein ACOZB3_11690 [Calditrichota bacterium]